MSLQSAHGGSIKVNATVVPTDRWEANWRVRDTEVTQSDSGGATLYFAVVEDNEWTWTAARDDINYPEAVGMTRGTTVSTMFFKLGAGALGDKLVNTLIIDNSPVVDNKNDVVRVTVRGKGGKVTANQVIT